MDYAFKYLGVQATETEASYPYTARDGTCKADKTKYVAQVSGYKDVTANTVSAMTEAAAGTVVSVAVDANAFFSYRGGILSGTCGTGLNHGVAVVGYGTENGKDFWIVRNSWGTTWGEAGYVRIINNGQDGPGECGILMKASYVSAVKAFTN